MRSFKLPVVGMSMLLDDLFHDAQIQNAACCAVVLISLHAGSSTAVQTLVDADSRTHLGWSERPLAHVGLQIRIARRRADPVRYLRLLKTLDGQVEGIAGFQ